MISIRRTYIFLVSAISLQSVTWALIVLLQGLMPPGPTPPITTLALLIAVLVIGLPFYLVHWIWASVLARRDADERGSFLRRLYVYAMLAAFLGAIVSSAYSFSVGALALAFNVRPRFDFGITSPLEMMVNSALALIVLLLLWLYYTLVARSDERAESASEYSDGLRRLYGFGFAATGLTMTVIATTQFLRYVMYQFGDVKNPLDTIGLLNEVARITVGITFWLIFWIGAQRAFSKGSSGERDSVTRKFYLYLVIFLAVLAAVMSATFIFVGVLRNSLGLPMAGDIRDPLSVLLTTAIVWAYHAFILSGDEKAILQMPRQAAVRRLYLYLVAAIGLGTFLAGLGGDVSVLIRSLAGEFFASATKEQLAGFTGALIAGLPVWLIPWRYAQLDAAAPAPRGAEERRSLVRKLYLYFYLFVATMTVLGSAIYIAYRLFSLALGERITGNLLSDLGHAMAYILIAVGVWLYHGAMLRGDGKIAQKEKTERLANYSVAVVDTEQGEFGRDVIAEIKRELQGVTILPIGLTSTARRAMGATVNEKNLSAQLANAQLIVGSWLMAAPSGAFTASFAETIRSSAARKLLVPTAAEGWDWSGVDLVSGNALARQTARAVKQIVEGQEVKSGRGLSTGAIIALVIGAPFGLCLIINIISALVFMNFRR